MKTSFDIENILYEELLKGGVKEVISGGVYHFGGRPDNSSLEDIVINTITLTQDFLPQLGNSNVNCYVADRRMRIQGRHQAKPDRIRLQQISEKVLHIIRNIRVDGLACIVDSMSVLEEPQTRQHFVNIRISWNIQTN